MESRGQPRLDLSEVLRSGKTPLKPPEGYKKKILNPGGDCPLDVTFSKRQVKKKIAFYRELNRMRKKIPRGGEPLTRTFALYGWEDTTTVRVYMRETAMKIVQELFRSDYRISVDNVHYGDDKDHGYVLLSVQATAPEIQALVEYIRAGATFFVYDGEEARYVAGNTDASEFIITKVGDPVQPARYWRRSQSFIAAMEEIERDHSTSPFSLQ